MAYRFKAGDRSAEQAVRRIAREQVDGALDAIAGQCPDVATHEVRKTCKKVRALLRLVRPGFADYARENAEFRDIARLLAGSRDAKVLLDTFDLLIAGTPKGSDSAMFVPLREHFERELGQAVQAEAGEARLMQARVFLEVARERIAGWALERDGWEAFGAGLGKILDRARKAAHTAAIEPTAVHYHELRKFMKYHWYHTRLLVPLWPETMQPRAAELSRLADLLGFHHDICVFEERLGAAAPEVGHPEAVEALQALAAKRRKGLEREAGPIVARLLAQTAEALAGHWHALWRIWHADAEELQAAGGETGI